VLERENGREDRGGERTTIEIGKHGVELIGYARTTHRINNIWREHPRPWLKWYNAPL
jgi:hypothetical protein